MAIKQVKSFTLDYSTIKELKERAKREQKSTSQYLQDLIEKEFYDEKIEDKFKAIDDISKEIKNNNEIINKKINSIGLVVVEILEKYKK